MPADEEITVAEAADLMNVSMPYVRELLERGDLRSLERTDVADHREVDRTHRLAAVHALASEAQELGLY
ncbi:MAG: excisionase family DNA-binding protein [Microthrixaceae bacterium]|jgi:excisionase family DNA binding protein|nr:excisionase family DNA-binding protein [Microthrixaceae bacterium]